jgi:hypothetical protein
MSAKVVDAEAAHNHIGANKLIIKRHGAPGPGRGLISLFPADLVYETFVHLLKHHDAEPP